MSDDWEYIRMVFDALKEVPELSPLFLLPFEEKYQDPYDVLDFTEIFAAQIADRGYDREDVALEFCNEPNIFSAQWKKDPRGLGILFTKAIPRIRTWAKNIKILTPSVANLDKRSQEYARRLFDPIKREARDYHVAFHRYPYRGHTAHPGYLGRKDEFAKFVAITSDGNDHEYWCTETGYSQWTKRQGDFPFCFFEQNHQRSEEEQAQFCAIEYDIWNLDTDVKAVTWYQINDGFEEKRMHGYGIRRSDMEPKAIADRFRQIHEDVRRSST
jgi:hypothetical protein